MRGQPFLSYTGLGHSCCYTLTHFRVKGVAYCVRVLYHDCVHTRLLFGYRGCCCEDQQHRLAACLCLGRVSGTAGTEGNNSQGVLDAGFTFARCEQCSLQSYECALSARSSTACVKHPGDILQR